MDENNLEEISGIKEVESMGGGDLSATAIQEEHTSEIPRLTPEEPENSDGGKGPIILLIATILVLVGLIAFGASSLSKSKTEKFLELFVDDYMFGMTNEITEMMSKDGKLTTEISVDPSEFEQFVGEEIPVKRLAVVSEQIKKGTDFSGKTYLDVDMTELVALKYIKTGEMVGITVPDLMNEYFVVKNENLKELVRKFGATEEEIAQIPDKFTVEELEKLLETSDVDNEKYVKIVEKYIEPISTNIESNLIENKDQELKIKEEIFTTTKHSLVLTEKDLYEFAKSLVQVAKDDEDLYNTLKEEEPTFECESFEEWTATLDEALIELDEILVEADDTMVIFELSAYVDGKDTMAIEMALPEENVTIRLATLNEKKTAYSEFVVIAEGGEVKLILITNADKDLYKGEIKVAANIGVANLNIDVAEYEISYSKDAKIETLDSARLFILNDESEESINTKLEEIQNNMGEYVNGITEKAPESLKTLLSDSGKVEEDYESEYDYDLDYEFEDETFKIEGAQVYVLPESNEIYGKMKLGMTQDEIIALMGEPDSNETYGSMTFMDWSDDEYYMEHSVIVEEGVVTEVSRNLNSSSYDNIQLSTELKTEIEDLEALADNVKEDMTFEEVKAILGDKYFESERTDMGDVTYTWYDKAEKYMDVAFDGEGKAWYVGMVWGSY